MGAQVLGRKKFFGGKFKHGYAVKNRQSTVCLQQSVWGGSGIRGAGWTVERCKTVVVKCMTLLYV